MFVNWNSNRLTVSQDEMACECTSLLVVAWGGIDTKPQDFQATNVSTEWNPCNKEFPLCLSWPRQIKVK